MAPSLMRSLAAIACFAATVAVPTYGADYWVAQNHRAASDENPGSAARPWKTLAKAVAALQAGDTLTIGRGMYRESLILVADGTPERRITIQAAAEESGDYEPVVLTGTDVIADWEPLGGGRPIWVHRPWTHVWIGWREDMSHGAPPPIGRCEQVILDGSDTEPGQLLKPVLSLDEMEPGTFLADPKETESLYVRLPHDSEPHEHRIEASVRNVVVKTGAYTNVRGLTIRHAANRAQEGALQVRGDGFVVEDCVVEWTNGKGIGIGGSNYILRRCISRHNGQLGMGGGGTDCLIEDCQFIRNNVKGFSAGWEAGGFKICGSRGAKVLRSRAISNAGVGMWFDIDNFAGEVRECYCADNTASGIFIEISGDFLVADNLCVGNGGREKGDWAGAGISVGESDDCYVAFNTCVGNQYGVSIRGQVPRKGGQEHVYTCKGITVRNNVLAYNTIAQFGLCWDNVFSGRHPNEKDMPEAQWQKRLAERGVDPARIQLLLDHNFYAAEEGQELVRWGVDWRAKWQPFTDLDAIRNGLGFEHDGKAGEAVFLDRPAGDFRLAPDSSARKFGAGVRYPAPGAG